MSNWNNRANTIMRTNYETGEKFNSVPQVINAGGKLPTGWKDEEGRRVKRESRGPKREPRAWITEKLEKRTWRKGEEDRIIQMREEGMLWKDVGKLYDMAKNTVSRRIREYKKK